MEFKDRLRQLRTQSGMTQGELARKLHYGFTAISNYENGRNEPSIADIIRLAGIFGVSTDYLLCAPPVGEFPKEPSRVETLFFRLSPKNQKNFLFLLELYLEKDAQEAAEKAARRRDAAQNKSSKHKKEPMA